MGLNYYCYEVDPCPTCGRSDEPRHIGKSSGGWCFGLHVYPDEEINSLDDWKRLWAGKVIKDEYDKIVMEQQMLDIITNREWHGREWKTARKSSPYGYASWNQFHAENESMEGPNGLCRSIINDQHCIGHDKGTWDLIVGEFS